MGGQNMDLSGGLQMALMFSFVCGTGYKDLSRHNIMQLSESYTVYLQFYPTTKSIRKHIIAPPPPKKKKMNANLMSGLVWSKTPPAVSTSS